VTTALRPEKRPANMLMTVTPGTEVAAAQRKTSPAGIARRG
jgi:hypothetical protein